MRASAPWRWTGAPLNLILHAQGDKLGPLAYAAWLVFSLGAVCFCDEMGAGRPLNRAGLIAFAAAFCSAAVALVGSGPGLSAGAFGCFTHSAFSLRWFCGRSR